MGPLAGHLARFGRAWLCLFGLLWAAAHTQALTPEVSRGLLWLQSQISSNEKSDRDHAVASIQAAQASLAAGASDKAIALLIDASERLLKITSVDLRPYRVEVDRLLQEAEARWFIAQP